VDYSRFQEARERLAPFLPPTPLVQVDGLGLKLESLQPTGAFKVRPAMNSLLADLDRARDKGVVTSSSGNFAQAVAWAATRLGVDAQIVMQRAASDFKRDRTRNFGGTVIPCDNTMEARAESTQRIVEETGRLLVHPYDSDETVAGDATVGLELLDQAEGDFCVVVPISGGGLLGGIAAAVRQKRPGCRVIGVQPEANPSMRASIDAQQRTTVAAKPSVADALVVSKPGERGFRLTQQYVNDVVLVSDDQMIDAVRWLAVEAKVVAEAGGAAAVAAVRSQKVQAAGLPMICIISGGNVEPKKLAAWLADA